MQAGALRPPAERAGLYIHVPFCSRICPYCDFAVTTGRREAQKEYVRHLVREIELCQDSELEFDTVYFGGGTPSALDAGDLEEILEAARRRLKVLPGAWITLEANPEDAGEPQLEGWRRLGVEALSLGVQSFDARELRFLGRRHRPEEARERVRAALEAGFHTVSLDLIFGLPRQRLADWTRSLEEAAALGAQHISAYQLTIHEGTPFARGRERGVIVEMPEPEQACFYEATHRVLTRSGYEPYEVSNFARGSAHRSRHNRKYWRHSPYLGLGPSAHSYDGARRWWNERDTGRYQERVARGERPIAGTEDLSREDLALETVMLCLRTTDGIDLRAFRRRFGVDLLAANAARIAAYVEDGVAELVEDRFRLTPRGLGVADGVARSLDLG